MAKQPCFIKYLSFEITEVCPGFEPLVGHCISLVSFVSKAENFGHHRLWDFKKSSTSRGIPMILVMSVILWHEKTKIHKIIGCGNFDVFSVKTIIHNNIKKMGHLI